MGKKISMVIASLAVSFCLAGLPLFAQRGGGGRGMGGGMGVGAGPGPGMGPANAGPANVGHEGSMGQSRMGGEQQGMSGSHMGTPKLGEKSPTNLLSQNTKLASNLQSLLPAGTNLQEAASGFKNLGQFVAAVHVSHNLGIPFDQLKSTMQSDGGNLGKAIETLNPNLSKKQAKSDAKTANKQAKKDLKEANS